MDVSIVGRMASTLPDDDDHPYRTGAWRPNMVEYDAADLDVVGEVPADLDGVYLRNTENPVHDSIGLYHPFDGDGMVHQIRFRAGEVSYRNRFVRTAGLAAEVEAGGPLWTGLLDSPDHSKRADGWGARGRMKDASSTDVVVHNGRALTTFYQCGEVYALDPLSLAQLGTAPWVPTGGVSAHTKVDPAAGELLFFNYGKQHPYMHYGVVDASDTLVHYVDVELPGPRLTHDMAFTERYAILNDCPLYWEPEMLAKGVHVPRFHPEVPTRFGIIPRRGQAAEIKWFEAEPTFVLHWINAFEDGDEVVLDGFFEGDPEPGKQAGGDRWQTIFRYLDLHRLQARPRRWRFNMATGAVKEEDLSDRCMEFGMINQAFAGRPYRYSYNMTAPEGWFLFDGIVKHDLSSGTETTYRFGDGVFGSETPMAPRGGGTEEDDGYLVTFTTDVVNDRSECLVLDARDIAAGPVARIRLPERISSGTHSCWAPLGA